MKDLRDEWHALLETWMAEYQPDTPNFEQHVVRAAQAEFALRQEERRFDEANTKWMEHGSDVTTWDAKQTKLYHEMQWRVNQAERTALRWSGVAERMRRCRVLDGMRTERSSAKVAAIKPPSPLAAPFLPLEVAASGLPFLQVIGVRVVDGVTTTTYNPTNDEMVGVLRKLNRPGMTVQRILRLPANLPREYAWARSSDGEVPESLEWCTTEEEFGIEAAQEEQAGNGHVLKSKHLPVREVVLL